MANILPTSIANVQWLAAMDAVAKERFENLDLSIILMYVVDTAPEPALFYLAEQFDVLGNKGWNLSPTTEERRALVKRAIELHQYKGTPWAIKEALKSVGFDDASIIEGVGIDYDGQYDYDGVIFYSGGNWATFRVIIEIPDGFVIDAGNIELARALILEYKNARSHLIDISFRLIFNDSVAPNDEFLDLDDPIIDAVSGVTYNGFANYDGANLYNNMPDLIELNIFDQFGNLIQSDEF